MTNNHRFFQSLLYGASVRKLILPIVGTLFLLATIAFSLVWPFGERRVAAAETTRTDAFPALQGKAAIDHLKQLGLLSASKAALSAALFTNYSELTEMSPADLVDQAYFGSATAISGNTLVVGAPHLFGSGSDLAAVYVFVRSGDIFTQQAKLTGLHGWDSFGTSVALDGNTLVVGAPGYNFSSTPVTGRAYVYVRTGTSWALQDTLTEGFLIESYGFGNSVAISGDTVVVGHSEDNIGINNWQGSAYVFVRSGTHWNKQQKLWASDGATSDKFGTSVAIGQNTILVGASHDTIGNNQVQGSAYVFTRSGTTWNQQQKLTANDGMPMDYFGQSVALEADIAAIGSPHVNDGQGAVYVFTRSGSSWSQGQKITVSDLLGYGGFGLSIALKGGTLAIGAPSDWYNNQNYRGSAYVFTLSNGTWIQQQKLLDNTGYSANYFGTSVALGTDTILIGAARKNQEKGAAVVFGLPLNNPPTITPFLNVSRAAGSGGTTTTIANVGDAEDAESSLQVTVNGGASAQVGAVTLSNLSVGAGGNVTATISTFCTPLLPSNFTLRVTDSGGAFTETTLTVEVTPNTAPVLSYANPQSVNTGGAKTINPATGLSDNGTISTVVVQSVTPAFSGTISVNSSGAVSISNAGPTGSYTVTIRATDNCGSIRNATFTLNVAANNCSYALSASGANVPGQGLPLGSINVTAGNGCNWTAVSNAAFITIASGAQGSGNGTVNYTVAANPAPASRTGTMTIAGQTFTVDQSTAPPAPTIAKKGDFDGDGKADLGVWNGPSGNWAIRNSANGNVQTTQWGNGSAPFYDLIVPGDYDGDGKFDLAIWRGADEIWYIRKSSDGQPILQLWGTSNAPYFDKPTPGDFDGDGKTDLAVWRPSTGTWFIKRSSDGSALIEVWGQNGDRPVAADYDGDGKTDLAVWRPNPGNWMIKKSSGGTETIQWGAGFAPFNDVPVPADYDGDGKADPAIWRGADEIWYIRKSSDLQPILQLWGTSNAPYFDIPAPADYDGDGKADIAVWRPSTGTWFVLRSSNGSFLIQTHGQNGDTPVPAHGVR